MLGDSRSWSSTAAAGCMQLEERWRIGTHRLFRTGAQCGSTLRCQIHGWEYDESGSLAKMTDGRSFKGFKGGERASLPTASSRRDLWSL